MRRRLLGNEFPHILLAVV